MWVSFVRLSSLGLHNCQDVLYFEARQRLDYFRVEQSSTKLRWGLCQQLGFMPRNDSEICVNLSLTCGNHPKVSSRALWAFWYAPDRRQSPWTRSIYANSFLDPLILTVFARKSYSDRLLRCRSKRPLTAIFQVAESFISWLDVLVQFLPFSICRNCVTPFFGFACQFPVSLRRWRNHLGIRPCAKFRSYIPWND